MSVFGEKSSPDHNTLQFINKMAKFIFNCFIFKKTKTLNVKGRLFISIVVSTLASDCVAA